MEEEYKLKEVTNLTPNLYYLMYIFLNKIYGWKESLQRILLNIEAIPIVMRATLQEAVDFVKTKPKSILNDDINMEGLVCKPAVDFLSRVGKRMIVKIKVEDFV